MKDNVKKCPFCSRIAVVVQIPESEKIDRILWNKWVVGCDDSLCPGYMDKCTPFYMTKEMAIGYWNRRGGNWDDTENQDKS